MLRYCPEAARTPEGLAVKVWTSEGPREPLPPSALAVQPWAEPASSVQPSTKKIFSPALAPDEPLPSRESMAAQGRMESIESAQDRWKSFDVATKDARGCLSAIGLFTVA